MPRLIRRAAPWGLAACLALIPVSGLAGPYGVDDLLRTETFGAVRISPDETRVLFERMGPYETADRFDLSSLGQWSTSEIWIAERGGARPPRRLLGPADSRGTILGSWSPSARRLAVHRLQKDRWQTGVADIGSGTVRWLDVGAEPSIKGESVVWRTDDELILLVRADGDLPYEIGGLARAIDQTEQRRRITASGGAATTVWSAGSLSPAKGYGADLVTLQIDLRTGIQTPLAQGQAVDIALSPDGRWLAQIDRGPPTAVDPEAPFMPGDPPEQRRLVLIDLTTGQQSRPCTDCDLSPGLLNWSADSRLLVWARDPSGRPAAGRLLALSPATGAMKTFELGGLEADVGAFRDARFVGVRAAWQGDRPLLLAREPGATRTDWYALNQDPPKKLTGALPASPGTLEAVWDDGLMVIVEGSAWAVDRTGQARQRPTARPVTAVSALTHWASPRLRLNSPPQRRWVTGRSPDGTVWRIAEDAPPALIADPDGSSAVLAAAGENIVIDRLPDRGSETLRVRQTGQPAKALGQINTASLSISFGRPVVVSHADRTGQTVTSWLYLPPGDLRPGTPVVVVAYPGAAPRPPTTPAPFQSYVQS